MSGLKGKGINANEIKPNPRPPKERVAQHRERNQKQGKRRVTVTLTAEASELLAEILTFKPMSLEALFSAAINSLAFNEDYWDPSPTLRNSHYQASDGEFVPHEVPSEALRPVPPWIIRSDREYAAKYGGDDGESDDWLRELFGGAK